METIYKQSSSAAELRRYEVVSQPSISKHSFKKNLQGPKWLSAACLYVNESLLKFITQQSFAH